MDFYTQNGRVRPKRLSEMTRKFAHDSLNRMYGLDTLKNMSVLLDDIQGFDKLSGIDRYDLAIRRIAEQAPIRICEGEKLSGAATLGWAIQHRVPATYQGTPIYFSVSHLTIDFPSVLTYGIDEIRRNAQAALHRYQGTKKEAFIQSCLQFGRQFSVIENFYVAVQIRLYIFYCSIFSPQMQDFSCVWVISFLSVAKK